MIFAGKRVKVIQDFQCIRIHVAAGFGIEEIPEHIYSHQVAGTHNAVVVDKPLESTTGENILVSIVNASVIGITCHNEIKHAALAGCKHTGNMLQH